MVSEKKINTYRDLLVWQKGIGLTRRVYELTDGPAFPDREKYGLVSQMRRAVVSVPSNIAEGQARRGQKEFVHFLYIARGSLAELDTQCVIAHELGYLSKECQDELLQMIDELQRMLFGLIRKLGGGR